MCLSQIDIHYSKDDKTEGIGYKVVFGNKDWFYTPIFVGLFSCETNKGFKIENPKNNEIKRVP